MNKLLSAAFLLLLLTGLSACGHKGYRVNGTINPADTSLTINLLDAMTGAVIDSGVEVTDGHFCLEGQADTARLAALASKDGVMAILVLENGDIDVNIDFRNHENTKVSGTPLNDDFFAYISRIEQTLGGDLENEQAFNDSLTSLAGIVSEAVDKHAADVVGYYVFAQSTNLLRDSVCSRLLKQLRPHWPNDDALAELQAAFDSKEATAEGKKFVDFEVECEGKTTRLSDYVGRGQYVLVDFWASWCGPCRAEIPNLIKAYNQYKDKGLVVLGVATWDEVDNTRQAIKELGIPYPQILNAQKIGSDAYGIQGIPEIILFGPDGTILQRGLRGEAIDAELQKIYNK